MKNLLQRIDRFVQGHVGIVVVVFILALTACPAVKQGGTDQVQHCDPPEQFVQYCAEKIRQNDPIGQIPSCKEAMDQWLAKLIKSGKTSCAGSTLR